MVTPFYQPGPVHFQFPFHHKRDKGMHDQTIPLSRLWFAPFGSRPSAPFVMCSARNLNVERSVPSDPAPTPPRFLFAAGAPGRRNGAQTGRSVRDGIAQGPPGWSASGLTCQGHKPLAAPTSQVTKGNLRQGLTNLHFGDRTWVRCWCERIEVGLKH